MATWDTTKYTTECGKCGNKYNVVKFEQPIREKGRFNCSKCGHEIERWNGGVDYTFTEAEEQGASKNPNHKCSDCKSYEDRGHNYCRMCGSKLKLGTVNYVRLVEGYNASEKYCGYCGGKKHECSCC